jgi:protein-tyrosine phosphatase
MYKIVFICMGNICRSPSAEGYFRHVLAASPLAEAVQVDSAATHGYHIGSAPDHRAIAVAASHGVPIDDLRARLFEADDFKHFDHVVAMDRDNLRLLKNMLDDIPGPAPDVRLDLMMDYAAEPGYTEVPDPYYGSIADFELMCDLLNDATRGLLRYVEGELKAS